MFTGIIEHVGEVKRIREEGSNIIFDIFAPFQEAIKVDQSIAHNGVCLTVTEIFDQAEAGVHYSVTAIAETLAKTNLGKWVPGTKINLERCLKVGSRLDGHFVQGHVDTVGKVALIKEADGSWVYSISLDSRFDELLVAKGSVCINGVSLTVVDDKPGLFTVAIIPYTWQHTTFQYLETGDTVNLEFDILGKYMLKYMQKQTSRFR